MEHRILVPPDIDGELKEIKEGEFRVEDIIAVVKTLDGDRELTCVTTNGNIYLYAND